MASTIARRARLDIGDGEAVDHPVLSERRQDRDGTTVFVGARRRRPPLGVERAPHQGGPRRLPRHRPPPADDERAPPRRAATTSSSSTSRCWPRSSSPTARRSRSASTSPPTGTSRSTATAAGRAGTSTARPRRARRPARPAPATWPPSSTASRSSIGTCSRGQREHIDFGLRWSSLLEARRGDGVVVARARPPGAGRRRGRPLGPAPGGRRRRHRRRRRAGARPATVPSSTCRPATDGSGRSRPMPAEVIVRAVERRPFADGRLDVDLTIHDHAGAVVLEIDGLQLLASTDHAVLERPDHAPVGRAAAGVVTVARRPGRRPRAPAVRGRRAPRAPRRQRPHADDRVDHLDRGADGAPRRPRDDDGRDGRRRGHRSRPRSPGCGRTSSVSTPSAPTTTSSTSAATR